MIKARKGNLVILGLSDENMKRLALNQPIRFNMRKDLDMDDIDFVIMSEPTVGDLSVGRAENMIILKMFSNIMETLSAGNKVTFTLDDLGASFVIFNGRTEEEMYESMLDNISLETTVIKL